MPYVPKNLFPRNTTISNNGEYVSFLGNVDEHDYIENVYLNLYNEKGETIATVDNANGTVDYPLLGQSGIALSLGSSTMPPYDYNNNQIKLDIPLSSVDSLDEIQIDVTGEEDIISFTLTNGENNSKNIEFNFRDGIYDILEIGKWVLLAQEGECSLYGCPTSKSSTTGTYYYGMDFQLVFNGYEWKEGEFLTGFYKFSGYTDSGMWKNISRRFYFQGFGSISSELQSISILTNNISYYINQDNVNWSFTLEGKNPDIFIQEGIGVSSEGEHIVIENGEFVESGQYFNDIEFEVVSGTEYFYFLEVLSVNQDYSNAEYTYTITFPQKLDSIANNINANTCQLTLGTNIIEAWVITSQGLYDTITFTSSIPYLTPMEDVTMSIAVELKRIKTKLSAEDFSNLLITNLSELHYKIMSKKISSPIVSYKNLLNFDSNLVQIERLNTKQCRVYSSYSDTFFTHTNFTLKEANGKTVSAWSLNKIKLDEIIDNLSNQEYTLTVEYILKNGLSNTQEIVIPAIEESSSNMSFSVEYDKQRQANKIEIPYFTIENGITTYTSVYKKIYKDGIFYNQNLLVSNQVISKNLPLLLYDYGVSFGYTYKYEVLYTIDMTENDTEIITSNTSTMYFESNNVDSITIEDWVGTAIYGVKYDYKNNQENRYELDFENVWYFDLDTQSNVIDFTNDRSVFLNLSSIPKIGVSDTNYMTQSISTKLGYLDENDVYVEDNGWKLNKFAAWANDGSIKILRLRNGYLIPVDIQLKNNTTNYSAIGEPSDITFIWTQARDHRTTALYSFS